MNNTPHPADQHDDDRDPEDPMIDSGKPSTWEQFAEDSQAGVPSDSQPKMDHQRCPARTCELPEMSNPVHNHP